MAKMRFRFIHSCMVLAVVGLLLFYSAFLTSPSYLDDNGEATSGNPSGSGSGQVPVAAALIGGSEAAPPEQPLDTSNTVTNGQSMADMEALQTVSGVSNVGTKTAEPAFQQLLLSSASLGPSSAESSKDAKRDVSARQLSVDDGHSIPNPKSQELVNPTLNLQQGGGVSASAPDVAIPDLSKHDPVPVPPNPETKVAVTTAKTSSPKPTAFRTADIYESGFSYANPLLCPNDGEEVRLFIMIMSAPGHFSARDAIRMTWGHFSQRMDISIAFLIGKTENETILEGIESERHTYDDLIVANFEDSYDNLTLKTMSTLEWIDTYCNQSQFVLKTDDDMFINVPNLVNFISKIEDGDKKQPKIYGRLAKKWKPVRNKKSKYYISFQQFKKTVYPDFTTGPAYLFSTRIARPLFDKGMETTYLKLEDVYTTGLLAQELKIKRMNIGDFANKKVNFHKTGFCALSRLISMHMVAFHEQFELWRKLLDGRTKCKVIYQNGTSPAGSKAVTNSKISSSSTGTSSNSVPGATVKSSVKKKK